LGRVDAIVFTGGIGERDYNARKAITKNREILGIAIDEKLNDGIISEPKDISAKSAKVKTLVIPTNEELEIAKQSLEIAGTSKG
jgi:acetate kinase